MEKITKEEFDELNAISSIQLTLISLLLAIALDIVLLVPMDRSKESIETSLYSMNSANLSTTDKIL